MKRYTKVTFILLNEEITRYFEGQPALWQIKLHTGNLTILDCERLKGNFQADYVKSKTSLSGYTTN